MAYATPRRRTERAITLRGGVALAQFEEGRRCSHPACDSLLSRYNPNDTCAAHGGWRTEAQRHRRPRR